MRGARILTLHFISDQPFLTYTTLNQWLALVQISSNLISA